MTEVTSAAAIVAIVEAIKRKVPQISGLPTVILAVAIGALAGYLELYGLNLQSGVVSGLVAVGGHTLIRDY